MKNLIAVVALSLSALSAEPPNAPIKAETDVKAEAEPEAVVKAEAEVTAGLKSGQGLAIEIARRLRQYGDDQWLLSEQDREKLPITITNQWQGKVCIDPTVRGLASHGLYVVHESGSFWCSWTQLPVETRQKYQAIVAEAQKKKTSNSLVVEPKPASGRDDNDDAPVSSSPTYRRAYGSSSKSTSSSAPDSEKTVHVRGYTKKDGTYVAPYNRSRPHSKK